ncbi:uncharacterized protein LOC130670900 [Microplitis mediator]|uniref:uncharacterized protein LOC130670900 n=1 Tax=Microplitis mediator TaxID=375433 RepID=UPI0025570BC5|nr:uncharacterized protein LOC130670900 [Microplitis mediator]
MRMVKLMSYPFKVLNARRGHSADCLISDWRLKSQLTPPETSLAHRNLDTSKGNGLEENSNMNVRKFKINSSLETIKIDRGVSEYWSNMLRYHWPIAVQSTCLIIIIVLLGPWIGLRCNQDFDFNSNENKFSLWPPFNSMPSYSSFRAGRYNYGGCNYGLYCGGIKTADGELVRRKASFLKRKRNHKELID